jgi:hypothetical protein
MRLAYDHRYFMLDNACLLRRYQRERISQKLRMVKADIGNDRKGEA